jgi:hypothetical protein
MACWIAMNFNSSSMESKAVVLMSKIGKMGPNTNSLIIASIKLFGTSGVLWAKWTLIKGLVCWNLWLGPKDCQYMVLGKIS